MQVDHMSPKALNRPIGRNINGDYVYADIDDFSNLMPSCRRCNHYKRAHSLKEFRGMIKTLHERIQDKYINKVGIDYGIITIKPFDGIFYFEHFQLGHKMIIQ
jgi:hypothetical protein